MKVSYFANARTALKNSLVELNFHTNDIILIPDFICDAVLIPIHQLKLKILYYSIDETFSPNWDQLSKIINENNIKALLMVHYFGQPNNLMKFIDLSKKNNFILIEDNAHGYGGMYKGKILGHFGDVGISSPRKTLNLPSGGVLYSKFEKKRGIKLNSFPIYKPKFFLKIILSFFINIYNKLRYYKFRNSNWNDPYLFKSLIEKDYKIDFISKYVIRKMNLNHVARKRRKNWKLWSDFAKENGLYPIYNDLHPESCPWALPLFTRNKNNRNKWINWGLKNNINIFMWPSLPEKIIKQDGSALSMWKSLVCISLDIPPKFNNNENKNL